MKIKYDLGFEDYYEARQVYTAKDRRISLWIAVSVFVLSIFAAARGAELRIRIAWVVIGSMFLVSPPLTQMIIKFLLRRAYAKGESKQDPNQKAEYIADISKVGIQLLGSPVLSEWSSFSSYSESERDFVLYRANKIDVIFPKRAFDNTNIETFRQILSAKVTSKNHCLKAKRSIT